MFWQKKRQFNWTFFIFGFITIGIITASALLILLFFRHAQTKEVHIIQQTIQTPIAIQQTYHNQLVTLKQQIHTVSHPTSSRLLQMIEQTMLSIVVPRDMRTAHLSAFFQMEHIAHSTIIPSQMVQQLDDVIQLLINKVASHTN